MSKIQFLIFSICLLGLAACGKKPVRDLGQFESYINKFEQKSIEYGKPSRVTDLIMRFGPVDDQRKRGVCEMSGDDTPVITINQAAWNRITEAEREELVFHELGHCVLHRKHKTDVTQEGIPASLMNPYALDSSTYTVHQTYYLHELFGETGSI